MDHYRLISLVISREYKGSILILKSKTARKTKELTNFRLKAASSMSGIDTFINQVLVDFRRVSSLQEQHVV